MCSLPLTECYRGVWQLSSCSYSFHLKGWNTELLWSWKWARCQGLHQRSLLWNGLDASCLSHAYLGVYFFRGAFPAGCSQPFFFQNHTSFKCLYSFSFFKLAFKAGPRAPKLNLKIMLWTPVVGVMVGELAPLDACPEELLFVLSFSKKGFAIKSALCIQCQKRLLTDVLYEVFFWEM